MWMGASATSAMASARCTPSASRRVGRVSAWCLGLSSPRSRAMRTSSSMTTPFSACMHTRVPSSAALRIARKMVASSASITPG